jgi:predicted nucleic acid-binding protein
VLAVDTNVIVRYLTADHPEQFAKASALIQGEDVYDAKPSSASTSASQQWPMH